MSSYCKELQVILNKGRFSPPQMSKHRRTAAFHTFCIWHKKMLEFQALQHFPSLTPAAHFHSGTSPLSLSMDDSTHSSPNAQKTQMHITSNWEAASTQAGLSPRRIPALVLALLLPQSPALRSLSYLCCCWQTCC